MADLAHLMAVSKAAFFISYRGSTVGDLAELRKHLSTKADVRIVDHTLLNLIAAEAGQPSPHGGFEPTAVIFVYQDPIYVAAQVREFEQTQQWISLKGGYVSGELLSASELFELVDIHTRSALNNRLLQLFMSVLSRRALTVRDPKIQRSVAERPWADIVEVVSMRPASGQSDNKFSQKRTTFEGRVKWFNSEKGFGFVESDDGSADVFVHYSALKASNYKSLEAGQNIEFVVGVRPQGAVGRPLYGE